MVKIFSHFFFYIKIGGIKYEWKNKKIGFEQIPGVYQDVERERTDGTIRTLKNIFLDINLDTFDKTSALNAIKFVCEKENEQER